MGIKDLDAYMIVMKGDHISEYYASVTIPVWRQHGFKVSRYQAYTPQRLPDFKLNFKAMTNDKYRNLNISKEFTPSEKGCWYSHVGLWKKCIEANEHILVLEHDSYLFYPRIMDIKRSLDFVTYAEGTACYAISPKFASFLWDKLVDRQTRITIGPYGFIDRCILDNSAFKAITLRNSDFVQTCFQVHNPKYGATIDHFANTSAEQYKLDIGLANRVLLNDDEIPNIKNKILTLAG